MIKKLSIFLVALSICCSAYAAPTWQKFNYFSNFGGLNDNLSPTEIQDNEATDIQNVVFDTGGFIKKRFGYSTIPNNPIHKVSSGSIVTVTGLSFFKTNDGTRNLVAVSNSDGTAVISAKLYDIGGGPSNGAWNVLNSSPALPSSYSDNYLASFAVAENKLIISIPSTNGNTPFMYTATGSIVQLTSSPNVPKSSIVVYHKNHLFLNDFSNPSRIWFSGLDDITSWTATDFIDVQTNDGTKVRGMVSAFDALYIFKDKSIWRLSGSDRDSWVLQKMVDGIGTMSHQSISVVNNLIYFTTSQNDVAVYDGNYQVVFLSQKIRNTIGGSNFSRNTTNLGLAFSTYRYNDYDYYVSNSTAGSGTNNQILLFDTAFKAWTKFKGLNANAWCLAEDSNGKNIMVFGDYSGYVHSYPNTSYYDGNVSTSSISAIYQTKWFRYPEVSLSDKYWRLLKTYLLTENTTGSTVNIECRSDYETSGKTFSPSIEQSGALWGSMVWGVDLWAGQSLLIDREEVEKGNTMFQLKYSNDRLYQGLSILGFESFIEPSERI